MNINQRTPNNLAPNTLSFIFKMLRSPTTTVHRIFGKSAGVIAAMLLFSTAAISGEVNRLTYTGSYSGASTFTYVHCTIRSGHLMAVMFNHGVGKANGPNFVFFATNPNGSNQHLGFVPTGKSQQSDYFNVSSATYIKGLDTSDLSHDKLIRFHNITLHNPRKPGIALTLNGSLTCTKPHKQW